MHHRAAVLCGWARVDACVTPSWIVISWPTSSQPVLFVLSEAPVGQWRVLGDQVLRSMAEASEMDELRADIKELKGALKELYLPERKPGSGSGSHPERSTAERLAALEKRMEQGACKEQGSCSCYGAFLLWSKVRVEVRGGVEVRSLSCVMHANIIIASHAALCLDHTTRPPMLPQLSCHACPCTCMLAATQFAF